MTHPWGRLYFMSTNRHFQFLTYANLLDANTFLNLEQAVVHLEELAEKHQLLPHIQIAVAVDSNPAEYYMADPTSNHIFYLDHVNADIFDEWHIPIQSETHLRM